MKVMVIVKATKASEAGQLPSQQLLSDMGKFNEELVKAGIMLAGEGLHPSSKGARVCFSGKSRTVIDGPFAETKELIAGFWLWKVSSSISTRSSEGLASSWPLVVMASASATWTRRKNLSRGEGLRNR